VDQGSQLGLVGSTGYSTGPHLHLSVYKNGKLIDPLSVLK
ncbi:MAG: M23 family metallopeptidase, partial [Treponema sp.]|nr:M23 family metallopeptidase [Treponema sp.]